MLVPRAATVGPGGRAYPVVGGGFQQPHTRGRRKGERGGESPELVLPRALLPCISAKAPLWSFLLSIYSDCHYPLRSISGPSSFFFFFFQVLLYESFC